MPRRWCTQYGPSCRTGWTDISASDLSLRDGFCMGGKAVQPSFSCRDASIQSSQRSWREHPSGRSRALPLSHVIDCTSGRVATCTRAVQHPHVSARGVYCIYISVCRNSHTSQTRLFWAVPRSQHSSGRVSPKGPTAFNQLGHEAHQMGLSAGWDRRGRVGGGGAAGHLVIVNIFAPPPPTPYCVTLLGERRWTAGAALALPRSARAFSGVSLANIFHHRSARSGCFEKSSV